MLKRIDMSHICHRCKSAPQVCHTLCTRSRHLCWSIKPASFGRRIVVRAFQAIDAMSSTKGASRLAPEDATVGEQNRGAERTHRRSKHKRNEAQQQFNAFPCITMHRTHNQLDTSNGVAGTPFRWWTSTVAQTCHILCTRSRHLCWSIETASFMAANCLACRPSHRRRLLNRGVRRQVVDISHRSEMPRPVAPPVLVDQNGIDHRSACCQRHRRRELKDDTCT